MEVGVGTAHTLGQAMKRCREQLRENLVLQSPPP